MGIENLEYSFEIENGRTVPFKMLAEWIWKQIKYG